MASPGSRGACLATSAYAQSSFSATRGGTTEDLYTWGDFSHDQYLAERAAVEREIARLAPVEHHEVQLSALAAYVESLPTAWADADQVQRNRLANIIYEEVWVNGPVLEYVKPRPELEPLFQVRTGATQPTQTGVSTFFSSGDPDGHWARHLPSLPSHNTASPVKRQCFWPADGNQQVGLAA